jgi:hypothetical protein
MNEYLDLQVFYSLKNVNPGNSEDFSPQITQINTIYPAKGRKFNAEKLFLS